jgi:hypothetical protein
LPCQFVNNILRSCKFFSTYPKARPRLPPILAHPSSCSGRSTWGGRRSEETLREALKLLRRQFETTTSVSWRSPCDSIRLRRKGRGRTESAWQTKILKVAFAAAGGQRCRAWPQRASLSFRGLEKSCLSRPGQTQSHCFKGSWDQNSG